MARFDLAGKAALVTGGGRGIGLATARALSARGASVMIVDLDAADAERAAAEVHDTRAFGVAGDVTDRGAMQRVVAAAVERFGGLDVVVANAGIATPVTTFRSMPSETFERVLDVNLMGVYRAVDAALPEIIRSRGHIVVISSVYAFMNGMGEAPYAMSKAAVEQFGRALRIELAQHGAGVSVAYFGFIDTQMVKGALDGDPLALRMMDAFPKPLRKRLQPSVAGEAIAAGIESRSPRIVRPRRWKVLSALRGMTEPMFDAQSLRDQNIQNLLAEMDSRAADRPGA
jgi:NAD(P)-dependent dehydrogenase (short-subunit alcohol dehydrogenase family)